MNRRTAESLALHLDAVGVPRPERRGHSHRDAPLDLVHYRGGWPWIELPGTHGALLGPRGGPGVSVKLCRYEDCHHGVPDAYSRGEHFGVYSGSGWIRRLARDLRAWLDAQGTEPEPEPEPEQVEPTVTIPVAVLSGLLSQVDTLAGELGKLREQVAGLAGGAE